MRIVWTGIAILSAAVLGVRLWVSSREWFIMDDFYFLRYVQSADFSWREVFWPTTARMIGAYRPLGLETYYFVNFELFGFNAFGYYAVGLLIQALTAGVIYRIGRQLELQKLSAAVAGVLVFACAPSVLGTYCACVHNYLLAALFYALAVSLLLDYLRVRRARLQLASCAALLVGLLCNDVCMTLPVVAVAAVVREQAGAWSRSSWREIFKAAWPQALVTALFLDFRIDGVPLRQEGWFYDIDFGTDMFWNSWDNLAFMFHGRVQLGVLGAALLALAVWSAAREQEHARTALRRVACNWILTCTWLLVTLLPFAVLAFPHSRFGLVIAPAAALTICALLDALLPDVRAQRWPRLAWLALIAVTVPWSAAFERAVHPEAAVHRRNFALLSDKLRSTPPSIKRIDIVYGAPGLADEQAAQRFQWETFNGAVVLAAVPERPFDVEFRKVESTSWIGAPCRSCERLYLQPDLGLSLRP